MSVRPSECYLVRDKDKNVLAIYVIQYNQNPKEKDCIKLAKLEHGSDFCRKNSGFMQLEYYNEE